MFNVNETSCSSFFTLPSTYALFIILSIISSCLADHLESTVPPCDYQLSEEVHLKWNGDSLQIFSAVYTPLSSNSVKDQLHRKDKKRYLEKASSYSIWHTLVKQPFVYLGYYENQPDPIQNGNYKLEENEVVKLKTNKQSIDSIQEKSESSCQKNEARNFVEMTGRLWHDNSMSETLSHYRIKFYPADDRNSISVKVDVYHTGGNDKESNIPWNRVFLSYGSEEDESIFGLGTQFTYWNFKGSKIPIIVSEQGVGRGLQPVTAIYNDVFNGAGGNFHTTYAPIPGYLTNHGRSILLKNDQISIFDFEIKDRVEMEVWISENMNPPKGKQCHTEDGYDKYNTSENEQDYTYSDSNSIASIEVIIFNNRFDDTAAMPLKMIETFTNEIGRMKKPLPNWVDNGLILALEGGSETIEKILTRFKKLNVPLAGLWLQDWTGRHSDWDGDRLRWMWEINYDFYPNWHELTRKLYKENIVPMVYINPYIADLCSNKSESTQNSCYRDFYSEGVKNSYFAKTKDGDTYNVNSGSIRFAILDVTNVEARKWYKNIIIDGIIGNASSLGWMADFGEYLPLDAKLKGDFLPYEKDKTIDDKIDEYEYLTLGENVHNLYPALWASLNKEAVAEAKHSEEIFYFMRSGWTTSNVDANCFWLGDQLVTWDSFDGLRSALIGTLTSGMTGKTFQHSDIGGYTMVNVTVDENPKKTIVATSNKKENLTIYRSKELLLRWIEFSCFSGVVFRSHVGNIIDTPSAQIWDDMDTLSHASLFSKIFKALAPYRRKLMEEASKLGHPIFRHMFLHFPFDEECSSLLTQFLMGEKMLIAPVLDDATDSIKVYLPYVEGGWLYVWDETVALDLSTVKTDHNESKGRWVNLPAPLGYPAVFVHKNDIEMLELAATIAQIHKSHDKEFKK